uniref:LanC lantibiotic synthetase component C-like 2 (bacterial) n=1 Tax=Sphaeramia orbicularis TaxID=375764 RepID=A0A673BZZ7_9TELE
QQMEEGLKTADPHDFSTYTGWTGIAVLYLQLHRVSHEPSHLQRALDYVKRAMRILNGRKVTFLCGDAGPLAVGAVVHHRLNNSSDSKDCVSLVPPPPFNNLWLDVSSSVVSAGVSSILDSGQSLSSDQKKTERCPLLYQWHNKQYIGAPPTASQASTTCSCRKLPLLLSNETDRLVHWCHGAPVVVHMLIMAYKVFKEDKYLKEASECAELIWQMGLLGKATAFATAHAGNGYAFLSLYKVTQDKKYLYRTCKFAEWCLDYGTHGCRIPDRPYSLFEVLLMGGTIHFLSSWPIQMLPVFPPLNFDLRLK